MLFRSVAWSLGHHHDLRSVPRVLGLLNDSDSNVQFAAASALAEIGATNSVRALKQAQAGAPKQARIAIASALAFLGSDAGDLTLRRAVESATDWECFLGIISLLQLNSPAARTWLATAEPQPEFRRVIDVGLKRGPGAAAADLLVTANEPESDWLYGDRRYFALRALGMLHDPATLGVIETFVSDPNLDLRSAARVAAWRLREPAAATGR